MSITLTPVSSALKIISRFYCRLCVPAVVICGAMLMSHEAGAEGVSVDQATAGYSAISEINGDSLSQVSGALSVNQAAGDSNAQSNSRAIAVTQEGGAAIAYTLDRQVVELNVADIPDEAVTRISDQAFNGTSGLLGISQASGVQNRQVNAFAMGMTIDGEVSDLALAETRVDAPVVLPQNSQAVTAARASHIGTNTFVGAAGVVQINQTSGSGNVNFNRIEVSTGKPGN